jgi:hypothetical protein
MALEIPHFWLVAGALFDLGFLIAGSCPNLIYFKIPPLILPCEK